MNHSDKELLLLAGKVAQAARALVGGDGINGRVFPADITEISEKAVELRSCLDEYDSVILNNTAKT